MKTALQDLSDIEIFGPHALQMARELSRVPEGVFTIAFFPYSKSRDEASARLRVMNGCRWRTQLPQEAFQHDSENYFLFSDEKGEPKMCYRYLIRYMGFPQDNFKLHKIQWLKQTE